MLSALDMTLYKINIRMFCPLNIMNLVLTFDASVYDNTEGLHAKTNANTMYTQWFSFLIFIVPLFTFSLTGLCEAFVRYQNNQHIECGHQRKADREGFMTHYVCDANNIQV